MNYRNDKDIVIRSMDLTDIKKLVVSFKNQGWHKPIELFEGYYNQQEATSITVLVAQVEDNVAGYVIVYPSASVGPFSAKEIPEIADLNVLIDYQNRGIASLLMDVAEEVAKRYNNFVSLAVGLHNGYGTAQRMYIKRGYLLDGSGVWYRGKQLPPYTECVNDDDLVLYLYKNI